MEQQPQTPTVLKKRNAASRILFFLLPSILTFTAWYGCSTTQGVGTEDGTFTMTSSDGRKMKLDTSLLANTEEDGIIIYSMFKCTKMPSFPGGGAGMTQFLAKHFVYPDDARAKNIQGTVVLSFIVTDMGEIKKITIVKNLGGGCAQAAIRLVNSMPKWEPGEYEGKPVHARYILPVNFTMR